MPIYYLPLPPLMLQASSLPDEPPYATPTHPSSAPLPLPLVDAIPPVNPYPAFNPQNYPEPRSIYQAITRFRPIAFRSDAQDDALSLRSDPPVDDERRLRVYHTRQRQRHITPPSSSSQSSRSTRSLSRQAPLSSASGGQQPTSSRPRLSTPLAQHSSPSPGPESQATTRMPKWFKDAVRQRHPDGIQFQCDPFMLVELFRTVEETLQSSSESDALSADPDELLRTGQWVAQYANAAQLFWNTTTLRYEQEQSNALRLFPAEAINGVLRDPRNFKSGCAPRAGTEWTGVKLRKTPGIADMMLTIPGTASDQPGTVTAVLEYKRLKVLTHDKMSGIAQAASSSIRTNVGFKLKIEPLGKLVCEPADAVPEDCLEVCLQIYAELHSNRVLWDILFNSCDTLIFRLDEQRGDLIHVSTLIHRDSARAESNSNLVSAMTAIALLPIRQASWETFSLNRIAEGERLSTLDGQATLEGSQDGSGQSSSTPGQVPGDTGYTPTTFGNNGRGHGEAASTRPPDRSTGDEQTIRVGGDRPAELDDADDERVGESFLPTCLVGGSPAGMQDNIPPDARVSPPSEADDEIDALPYFPHGDLPSSVLRMTWDKLRAALPKSAEYGRLKGLVASTGTASISSPSSGRWAFELRIGNMIGQGRLWDVYEGLLLARPLSSTRLADGSDSFGLSLHPHVWSSSPSSPSADLDNPSYLPDTSDACVQRMDDKQYGDLQHRTSRQRASCIPSTFETGASLDDMGSESISETSFSSIDSDPSEHSIPTSTRSSDGSSSSGSTVTTSFTSIGSGSELMSISVAVKIFDPAHHDPTPCHGVSDAGQTSEFEQFESAKRETEMYIGPLEKLQGSVVPHCYALFEWERSSGDDSSQRVEVPKTTAGFIMVMDKVRPLFPGALSRNLPLDALDDQDRLDVAKLVNKLHVAGWTHGDIEYRHVVVSCDTDSLNPPPDEWRLIDFDKAERGHEAVHAERVQLTRRLGLCAWV